jgi:hypothetical protein
VPCGYNGGASDERPGLGRKVGLPAGALGVTHTQGS